MSKQFRHQLHALGVHHPDYYRQLRNKVHTLLIENTVLHFNHNFYRCITSLLTDGTISHPEDGVELTVITNEMGEPFTTPYVAYALIKNINQEASIMFYKEIQKIIDLVFPLEVDELLID